MICIIGLPNAGKTTYSNNFENVFHMDSVPRKELWGTIKKLIDDYSVFEGLFNTKQSRLKLLSMVDDEKNTCIWIDTPYDICLEREKRHSSIVKSSLKIFEPPTYAEGWDEIIIIK